MLVEVSNLLDLLSKEGLLKERALVDTLSRWVASIRDDVDRDCISGELGVRVARLRMLDEAEDLTRGIVSIHERPQYMRRVAESELEVGEKVRALSLLREAIEATDRMPPDWYWERAEVLAYIAEVLNKAGQHSAALEQWNAAVSVAKAGDQADPNAIDCSAVLWTISKMLAEAGQVEKAREVASEIRDENRRKGALEQLGRR
jgi:tetratricopeptide (TPR) repeat protein